MIEIDILKIFFTTMDMVIFIGTLLFYVLVIIITVFILLDNKDPGRTLAWLFIFWLFPVLGFIAYLLLGRSWKILSKKKKNIKKELYFRKNKILYDLEEKNRSKIERLSNESSMNFNLISLAKNNSNSILTFNNKLNFIQTGEEKFNLLINDIKKAKKFIHLEYFIWRKDPITKKISRILKEKIKEGLEIRILYDPQGSFLTDKRYFIDLKKNGVKVASFLNKLSTLTITTINHINHRKIAIIDGKISYCGGMNMGQEYIDGGKDFEYWRDTHMRFEGEVTKELQALFATDWIKVVKENLFLSKYYPKTKGNKKNDLPIQIVSSGPDSNWDSIKQTIFAMITQAKNKIYIQTPYFLPDYAIVEALKQAALSQKDVKVMIPLNSDKRIIYWATFSYLEELLEAGVNIYFFKKGFLHSKNIMIDSKITSSGTSNFDSRSFFNDYEVNAIIYSKKHTLKMEKDFYNDMKNCKKLTLSQYKKENILKKFRNSLARLLAPVL